MITSSLSMPMSVRPDALRQVAETFHRYPSLTALIGWYDDTPAEKKILSHYKNLFYHYVHQHARNDASTFWGAAEQYDKPVLWK